MIRIRGGNRGNCGFIQPELDDGGSWVTLVLEFDHIGIVVPNLSEGRRLIEGTLPVVESSRPFDDPGLGVSVQFYRDRSGVVFELIAPLGDASPIRNTLTQVHRLNQLAYRCRSLEEAARTLRSNRVIPLGAPAPALAFDNALVQFFWSPLGHVIELIQSSKVRQDFMDIQPADRR